MKDTATTKGSAIIRAAVNMIAEHGFHGTSMPMIARRSGIATGTLYRHFESKDVLIHEAYADALNQALAAIEESFGKETFREQFLTMQSSLMNFFLDKPALFKFVEQYLTSPYYGKTEKAPLSFLTHEPLKESITAAKEQKILKDLTIPSILSIAIGPLLALAREHMQGRIALDGPMRRTISEACWDGIKEEEQAES